LFIFIETITARGWNRNVGKIKELLNERNYDSLLLQNDESKFPKKNEM